MRERDHVSPRNLPREPSEVLGGKFEGRQQLDQGNIVQRVVRVRVVELGQPPEQPAPGLNVDLGLDQSLHRQRLAGVGFLLDDLPGLAVARRERGG